MKNKRASERMADEDQRRESSGQKGSDQQKRASELKRGRAGQKKEAVEPVFALDLVAAVHCPSLVQLFFPGQPCQ